MRALGISVRVREATASYPTPLLTIVLLFPWITLFTTVELLYTVVA